MAALQRPVDYAVPVPSVANPLELLSQGTQMRQQNRQAQAKMALDLTKLSNEQQTRARAAVSNAILLADTPEKWAAMVPQLAQRLGPEFAQEYADFSTRDAALAEMGTTEQVSGEVGRRATASRDAAKDAGKAPDVVSINGIDHIWDEAERKFVPQPGGLTDQQKAEQKGGITVRTLPDGTTETIIGGSNSPLTAPTANEVQKRAVNTAEMGSRIAGIMQSYKPEYQTIGTKLANSWRSGKASIDPKSLGPGEEQALTDFSKFRSEAIGNLNRILNELSGAAVSPSEAERLKSQMPNPGTGIFNGILDGDDPVTFQAKLQSVADQAEAALARYAYYQAFGTPSSIEEIPLNDVKKIGGKWYVKRGDKVYEVGEADAAQP